MTAISEATTLVVDQGVVRVRTPSAVMAARLVRFWTGSGAIDIQVRLGPDASAGGIARIPKSQMNDVRQVVQSELVRYIGHADRSEPA